MNFHVKENLEFQQNNQKHYKKHDENHFGTQNTFINNNSQLALHHNNEVDIVPATALFIKNSSCRHKCINKLKCKHKCCKWFITKNHHENASFSVVKEISNFEAFKNKTEAKNIMNEWLEKFKLRSTGPFKDKKYCCSETDVTFQY